ncbi:hypothetical protein EVAR_55030_1 [Eumeta japonica]|uniref:Reverse transcriptase domain-containing protein n=1 Tax=Eumeta variegata TaxID=151549 RepID=A0A4C1ZPD7_EUMVA|nr:hypothetical protein EVAR_55030_1 [Eumeta japonica]
MSATWRRFVTPGRCCSSARTIELITGSDVRRGKSGEPVASLTGLGVSGEEHFEIESLGITQRERENAEVKRASRILNDTTRRIGNKWETGLLWKEDDPRFPDNYNGARKRLTNIENKMDRDPFRRRVHGKSKINRKRVRVGWKIERKCATVSFSHFAVTNPNKPNKIRVVFDAAARFEGKSLNDYLLSGPDLLNSLTGILFRFRIGSVAFTGDIRDMFLRVRVCAPDQRAAISVARCRSRQRARVYAMTSLILARRHRRRPRSTYSTKCGNMFR